MALFQSKKVQQLQVEIKSLQAYVTQQMGMRFINDSIAYYPDWHEIDAVNTYATVDQIYSVINKIAETSASIPEYAYIVKPDEKAFNNLRSLTNRQFYTTKGLFDILTIQRKALEDALDTDPLYRLLENPNDYQSKTDFFLVNYLFYLSKGESIIYKMKPGDGPNNGVPKQVHILHPENVVVHATREFPHRITGYSYIVNATKLLDNVPPEDVIHWKKPNPSAFITGQPLRGLAPLDVLCSTITRLSEADARSISQLKNGGVPSIVYDKGIAAGEIGQEEFDRQRQAFYKFMTSSANTGSPWFTANEKGILQTGSTLADLKLIELQKVDFKRVCNVYKVSDVLFNSDTASTESNVQEQIKQMYTSACLPMVYSLRDKLNSELVTDFKDKPRFIDADISFITELQDDILRTVQAMTTAPGGFTMNEFRLLFKYDERDEPFMDEVILKDGFHFYSDTQLPAVDTNLLNNANANDYNNVVKMPA